MNLDEVRYSIKNLMSRSMRSWLTVLSILIGVMAIFAIVSFGLGIQDYVNVLGQQAGTDKFYIQPKGFGTPGTDNTFSLSKKDVDFVSKINGVRSITGLYMKPVQVKSGKQSKYAYLAGYDSDYYTLVFETFTISIQEGRALKKDEANKITMGYSYMLDNKVFKKALNVGDKVELNGKKFTIVGFYEAVGNPQDDTNIYITNKGFESLFPDSKDKFSMALGQANTDTNVSTLSDKITEKLRKKKGQKEGSEDFFVQTFEDALSTFSDVINILNGILLLIALVSLVVASVNIMNTMYTAVLERKKEIGIMKAIGARNSDILLVFIMESGILGMIGGIIGVFFGYIIAKIGGSVAANAGFSLLKPIFPWYLIAGCIAFAFFVGAIAGVLPAWQAAHLNPVDALRENE